MKRRTVRTVLVIVGVFLALGVSGYFLAKKYKPQFFDREEVDAGQLETLKTAPLTPTPQATAEVGWPQWFGPTRDGRAPAGPLRTDWEANPPKQLWSKPCGGGYASVVVVNGRAYTFDKTSSAKERVMAFDAETGVNLWETAWDADYAGISYGSGPRATPTIQEEKLYALGATGKFVCIDLTTTKPLWEHDLKTEFKASTPTWGFASAPLIEGNLVIVQPGGKNGTVVAFHKTTGEVAWKYGSEPTGYSSPTAATCAGVRQIIAVTGETILGLRPETGELLWKHEWITEHKGNIAAPVIAGDYVFVSANYSKGCVLLHLTADGSSVKAERVYFRKARVMQNHHSTCVFNDGFLYGYDLETLRCVDLRAGEPRDEWVAKDAAGRQFAKGSLILAGKHLLGLTQTGTLFLADADPEEFRFRGKLEKVLSGSDCWAVPTLVSGRIYLRDSEKVVCLDVR